jgi:hypothetical protein
MLETTRWPQLKPVGRYKDWVGNTYIFELH